MPSPCIWGVMRLTMVVNVFLMLSHMRGAEATARPFISGKDFVLEYLLPMNLSKSSNLIHDRESRDVEGSGNDDIPITDLGRLETPEDKESESQQRHKHETEYASIESHSRGDPLVKDALISLGDLKTKEEELIEEGSGLSSEEKLEEGPQTAAVLGIIDDPFTKEIGADLYNELPGVESSSASPKSRLGDDNSQDNSLSALTGPDVVPVKEEDEGSGDVGELHEDVKATEEPRLLSGLTESVESEEKSEEHGEQDVVGIRIFNETAEEPEVSEEVERFGIAGNVSEEAGGVENTTWRGATYGQETEEDLEELSIVSPTEATTTEGTFDAGVDEAPELTTAFAETPEAEETSTAPVDSTTEIDSETVSEIEVVSGAISTTESVSDSTSTVESVFDISSTIEIVTETVSTTESVLETVSTIENVFETASTAETSSGAPTTEESVDNSTDVAPENIVESSTLGSDPMLMAMDTKLLESDEKILLGSKEPKRLGAYIVIGLILLSFLSLIGYIALKKRINKRRKEMERNQENKDTEKALLSLSDYKDHPEAEEINVKNNEITPIVMKQNSQINKFEKNTNFSSPKNLNTTPNEKNIEKDNVLKSTSDNLTHVIIEDAKELDEEKVAPNTEKLIVRTHLDQDSIPKKAIFINRTSGGYLPVSQDSVNNL